MTHEMIRRFKIDGTLSLDADLIKAREFHERILDSKMRDQGFVPLFDVRPAWSTVLQKETFSFLLTVHGVYVGKEESWLIEGISEDKALRKPTPQSKSKPS